MDSLPLLNEPIVSAHITILLQQDAHNLMLLAIQCSRRHILKMRGCKISSNVNNHVTDPSTPILQLVI